MKKDKVNSYICSINADAAAKLEKILQERGWEMNSLQHAFWRASRNKTSITAYKSGKLTVQGRDTGEFVMYILEPEILGTFKFGYENIDPESGKEIEFSPHAGVDESGKGDFFGPLVISAVFVDKGMENSLKDAGVKDSKTIKSEKKIIQISKDIRTIVKGNFSVIQIGPEAYNRLYGSFRNLNRLLAWGHARAIENILEKAPQCNRALSDKFGDERLIQNALLEKGRKIKLEQQTKAESDIAVAAASILAREMFLNRMRKLSLDYQMEIPRGAGEAVDKAAAELVAKYGIEVLGKIAKTHFRTASKFTAPENELPLDRFE
ncbi:MAG: ribonuclease HIII [Lentisphaerae bacterium GWF2_44_16]|nr:MAG: ribonuclease HIII [Lentisphaerae bacterium GWF2_44_16]